MAVKNSLEEVFNAPCDVVMDVLRNPNFATLIDAEFIEEAKTASYLEFRYIRKTTLTRYGRNFFIRVNQAESNKTNVTIITQSRKVTILFDSMWRSEIKHISSALNILIQSK